MPYLITGCDSAGLPCVVNVSDEGVVSGDALLTEWLNANPVPAPPEGDPPHVSGAPLSEADLEHIRQHVSKLLTYTQLGETPPEVPPALARASAPDATHPRYTAEELDALTVADLREFATAAQIAGTSHMLKAELIAALLAQQGS